MTGSEKVFERRIPHRQDGELDLLVDVFVGELDVAEVLPDVEGKLAVFITLDDTFAVFQADDDSLKEAKN